MPLPRALKATWLGVFLVSNALGCGKSSDDRSGTGGSGGASSGGASSGGSGSGGAGAGGSGGVSGNAGGGSSGMSGGGTSGSGGADQCGNPVAFGPTISTTTPETAGAPQNIPYEGPAVVERSTSAELLLILGSPDDGAGGEGGAAGTGEGGTGGDATSRVQVRSTIQGLDPMPMLAAGTKLWVKKNPMVDPPFSFLFKPGRSLSVFDREGGTLLFGAAIDDFESTASPVKIGDVTPVCAGPSPNTQCAPGASMTYSSVEVLGDSPVVVERGMLGKITLGGVPYDVRAAAWQEHGAMASPCPDYGGSRGVSVDVRATRLDDLWETLEVGPAPSCVPGNDPDPLLSFSIYRVDFRTTHEGIVSYIGRDASATNAYSFAVPDLASVAGDPPVLSIRNSALFMPEPAIGQTFWVSYLRPVEVLRESQDGPVIFAQSFGFAGEEALAALDALSDELGVSVALEDVCEYEPGVALQDTVFATTPEVRVATETTGMLELGGRSYRVWTRAQGSSQVTVYPAD